MKKVFFYLFMISFLMACQNNKTTDNSTVDKSTTATTETHQDTSTVLALNGNAKWKADSSTNDNLVDMKTMADNFRILPFPALDEYHILGNDLQKQIDKMVSECKMKGADHDELHKWLTPVINDVNQLKNVADTTTGKPLFTKIDRRIDEYRTYFE